MNRHTSISLLFSLIIISASCKKDDNNSDTKGSFIYKANTYALGHADLYWLGDIRGDENGGAYSLEILPPGVTPENVQSGAVTKAWALEMDLYTPNKDKIVEGIYNFDSTKAEKPFFFDGADVDFIDNNIDATDDVTGGTIDIKVSGDIYTMTFNFDLKSGTKLTGNYTGGFDLVTN